MQFKAVQRDSIHATRVNSARCHQGGDGSCIVDSQLGGIARQIRRAPLKPTTKQAIKQILGMVKMAFRYNNELPDPKTGASRVEYRLPFEGAWVVVNGGIDEETSHSWDVWTQRYAFVFVVTVDEGRSCAGIPMDVRSYYCYGRPVLAPTDGVVVEARDSDPDTPPAPEGQIDCAGDDIRGNYVLIRHSDDEFSCLAHLAPGSVAVSAGEHVARGQHIGRCGSSGNSSEPHLHFHVQAGQSFYESPGVPIRFADVCAEPAPHYEIADPRPQPIDPCATFPPYLTRGLKVSNCDGCSGAERRFSLR